MCRKVLAVSRIQTLGDIGVGPELWIQQAVGPSDSCVKVEASLGPQVVKHWRRLLGKFGSENPRVEEATAITAGARDVGTCR